MSVKDFLLIRILPIWIVAFILLIVVAMASCNGGEPPPEPCKPPEECITTGGTWNEETCECECSGGMIFDPIDGCKCEPGFIWDSTKEQCGKEPDPPPPPKADPKDYYTLTRAGTYKEDAKHCDEHTGMVQEICWDLCPWACWRDPEYVAMYCGWGCADGSDPMFPLNQAEMEEFAETGLALNQEGERWMQRLPKVNRRCNEDHPEHDPAFCGRSGVRKNDYVESVIEFVDRGGNEQTRTVPGRKPPFKIWREKFTAHSDKANVFRDLAQADPVRSVCAYDSIKGWCQCRNKNGGPQ
jgi:hypothetical protein